MNGANEVRAWVEESLRESALELFRSEEFGLTDLRWQDGSVFEDRPSVVAILGYTGQVMQGALVLHATREAVAALVPAEMREMAQGCDDLLRDQLGELANQLLGRVKNSMLGMGVVLSMSTPTTAVGRDIRFGSSSGDVTPEYAISWAGGSLLVRLDATISEDPVFVTEDMSSGLSEGELTMF